MRVAALLAGIFALGSVGTAQAEEVVVASGESPRTATVEVKLGGYKPLLSRESSLTSDPYAEIFGSTPMLLAQVEVDRMLWQAVGTVSLGFTAGYAEKYGKALLVEGGAASEERAGFFVVPLELSAIYRFDYPALHWNIPLVPYAKGGVVYIPWWSTKGSSLETVNGKQAIGGKWGIGGTLGLSLLLDFFEPQLARDFDSDLGVNHSYLFAEYNITQVNSFSSSGFDLSGRYWMFGAAFDF